MQRYIDRALSRLTVSGIPLELFTHGNRSNPQRLPVPRYKGLECLFDFLEEYSDSTGEPFELDVVALCCEFYEEDAEDIAKNYSIDIEGMDDEEIVDAVREYLEENTIIVGEPSEGLFVYQAF